MALQAPRQLFENGIGSIDSAAQAELGAMGYTSDGGTWRYVGAGGAVAANSLVVAGPRVANHQNIVVASALAVGGRSLTVTLGATAATLDEYAQGYLEVISGTGAGSVLAISGNGAAASSGAATIVLATPSTVALDTTSHVNLVASSYAAVVNSATASETIGVAMTAIPSGSFGWVKTSGEALVSASAAVAQGAAVAQDTTTAGDVVTAVTLVNRIGQAKAAIAAAGLLPIRLTLE